MSLTQVLASVPALPTPVMGIRSECAQELLGEEAGFDQFVFPQTGKEIEIK